jgi:hypothetical protein
MVGPRAAAKSLDAKEKAVLERATPNPHVHLYAGRGHPLDHLVAKEPPVSWRRRVLQWVLGRKGKGCGS